MTATVRAAAPPRPSWAARALLGAVVVALFIVGGTAFRVWQVARQDDRQPAEAVVVLGAAQYDGRPSPVLQARLEHALTLYQQGVAPRIVTVGGAARGDQFSEAESGDRWLTEHGVPNRDVLPIDEGRDTLGSFEAVGSVAAQHGWGSAVIVSDPWHSLRSRTMARDVGLDATTSPAKGGPVSQTRRTQFFYIVRETAGLLYYHLAHASSDFADPSLQ